jgi:biotin carboxyl carrier protein
MANPQRSIGEGLETGRKVGGSGPVKYLATLDDQQYRVVLDPSGLVSVNDTSYAVDLQSVDGGFHYSLLVGATSHEVFVERCEDVCFVVLEGHRYQVRVESERLRRAGGQALALLQEEGDTQVTSPMPGVVVAVLVEEGQTVKTGESLAILEAMKMENEIRASRNGLIARVCVAAGQRVSQGDELFRIGASSEGSSDGG